eukprot:INCI15376.2.p1 GENE.INCI15376.2~~INCI15376.2.p1  ORF type:complete len:411 (-),score=72.68 INCI15376.2:1795-3027(-)
MGVCACVCAYFRALFLLLFFRFHCGTPNRLVQFRPFPTTCKAHSRSQMIAMLAMCALCALGALTSVCQALSFDTLNSRLIDAEYAVRGPVVDLAKEIAQELKDPDNTLPFDELIFCNIGNPQALGQKPLKFNREVLSLLQMPRLLEDDKAKSLFSETARARAQEYLDVVRAVGAYSDSQGYEIVRREVAAFITERDGPELGAANPDQIFLTDGASAGVKMMYQATIRDDHEDGIMVPIPQYPLYSAVATLSGAHLVGYYLDEDSRWATYLQVLEESLQEARAKGVEVRSLVVINPGNPTGQCLTPELQREIVRFCIREGLVLLADEVYQENVYAEDREFSSFRKIVLEMGQEAANALQLVSFHSTSKGFIGECGLRGGYFQAREIVAAAIAERKNSPCFTHSVLSVLSGL